MAYLDPESFQFHIKIYKNKNKKKVSSKLARKTIFTLLPLRDALAIHRNNRLYEHSIFFCPCDSHTCPEAIFEAAARWVLILMCKTVHRHKERNKVLSSLASQGGNMKTTNLSIYTLRDL